MYLNRFIILIIVSIAPLAHAQTPPSRVPMALAMACALRNIAGRAPSLAHFLLSRSYGTRPANPSDNESSNGNRSPENFITQPLRRLVQNVNIIGAGYPLSLQDAAKFTQNWLRFASTGSSFNGEDATNQLIYYLYQATKNQAMRYRQMLEANHARLDENIQNRQTVLINFLKRGLEEEEIVDPVVTSHILHDELLRIALHAAGDVPDMPESSVDSLYRLLSDHAYERLMITNFNLRDPQDNERIYQGTVIQHHLALISLLPYFRGDILSGNDTLFPRPDELRMLDFIIQVIFDEWRAQRSKK